MIYEFPKAYTFDTGDTSVTGSGSGIHLYGDVTMSFDLEDRLGNTANTFSEISQNPSIGDMTISILNTGGSVVYSNYYSGNALKSFTFTRQNNIDIFGSYQRNFGLLISVKDETANTFYSKAFAYGNVPEFKKITITDGVGENNFTDEPTGSWVTQISNASGWTTGDFYASLIQNPIDSTLVYVTGGIEIDEAVDPNTADISNLENIILCQADAADKSGAIIVNATGPVTLVFYNSETSAESVEVEINGGGLTLLEGLYVGESKIYQTEFADAVEINAAYLYGEGTTYLTVYDGTGIDISGQIASGVQSGIATGTFTAPSGRDITLNWNARVNQGANYGRVKFNGTTAFEGSDLDTAFGSRIVSGGTTLNVELFYSTTNGGLVGGDVGMEFVGEKYIEPNDTTPTTTTSGTGDPLTGRMSFDIEFYNDPSYTKYKNVEVYYSTTSGVSPNDDTFLRSIPIFTQSNKFSFSVGSDDLNYNTDYYFLFIPYSEIGSGQAWEVGPHRIAAPAQDEQNPEVNGLFIVEGSENAFLDLITGSIPTTGATIIDTIPTGTYHAIDYLIKIQGTGSEIFGTKLTMIITGSGGTGVSFGEYAESTNSDVTYSVTSDGNYIYLKAQLTSVPATFKAYKTSI